MKKRTKSKSPAKSKPSARKKAAPPPKAAVAKSPAKTATSDPLDDFITAGANNLKLKVEKSWMKAVRFNLRVTLDLGAMVGEFPLPDDAEPAPVFRA
jgi:1-carboxybiuret hydrolase subunit AtzG-like protein